MFSFVGRCIKQKLTFVSPFLDHTETLKLCVLSGNDFLGTRLIIGGM